jgi:hypothetical protein
MCFKFSREYEPIITVSFLMGRDDEVGAYFK